MTTQLILFIIGAVTAILGGAAVILAKSPLRAALYLIVSLCGVALLYVTLHAPFVAAMQILVYAGAILVLFVFVIMLLNLGPDSDRPTYLAVSKVLGTVAVGFICFRAVDGALTIISTTSKSVDGSVKSIGKILLTDYLFAFEAISALLLVAIVGAVVLGLKRLT